MISLNDGRGVQLCDGVTRREAMRVGGLGLGGLTLAGLLRLQAEASEAQGQAGAVGRGVRASAGRSR